ncbi:RDD family protein [Aquimonas voraii]|uniref:Uncharacterized membrane protein YckC, RDD family n=1 Tax=Aquimonas voraii TaxID=265719 RepID=A0A1G6WP61_9GAMM|nr:RDD family protein [Aquimonas voraii]SDD67579.1 Uncharacterized membrane protein YckC, RDD family [Aquimonas voraii]
MNPPAAARTWYYVDAQGQQQGPVSAAVLVGHVRQGRLLRDSLVWREGWSDWQPLSAASAELGLDALAAPEPPPAPTAMPASAAAAPTASPAAAANSPYAPGAARLDVEVAWANSGDVVYAGFLRRWAALFLDAFLVGLVAQILAAVAGGIFALSLFGGLDERDGPFDPGMVAFYFVFYLIYFLAAGLYYSLMESSSLQATVGKLALGIKVTDLEGRRLSFAHALGRWFSAALSYLTLWIGFFMAGLTERKRALHDFVAGTLVVDKWAFTAHPERQQRGLGGCVIVFLIVVVGLGGIALLGMLAAIAIPAYQDYTERARSRGAQLAPPAVEAPELSFARAELPGGGRLWLEAKA